MSARDPREYGIGVGDTIDVTIRGRVTRIGYASLNIDVPGLLGDDYGDVVYSGGIPVYVPAEGIMSAAVAPPGRDDTTPDPTEAARRARYDIACACGHPASEHDDLGCIVGLSTSTPGCDCRALSTGPIETVSYGMMVRRCYCAPHPCSCDHPDGNDYPPDSAAASAPDPAEQARRARDEAADRALDAHLVADVDVAAIAEVIEGETARYCGPGYGSCGPVAVDSGHARDLAAALVAALPGLGWIRPDDEFGRDIVEANGFLGQALTETRAALGWARIRTDYEWSTHATDGPQVGEIVPHSAEAMARDWIDRRGGVLLRRPVARGPWEEMPRG